MLHGLIFSLMLWYLLLVMLYFGFVFKGRSCCKTRMFQKYWDILRMESVSNLFFSNYLTNCNISTDLQRINRISHMYEKIAFTHKFIHGYYHYGFAVLHIFGSQYCKIRIHLSLLGYIHK